MKVSVRNIIDNDMHIIHYAIKRTFHTDFTIDSSLNILVACDTYAKNVVVYGFIIVNANNELVFAYTKPLFRLAGIFTKLINKLPQRPVHYLNFVNYKADKIMRHNNIEYKRKIIT